MTGTSRCGDEDGRRSLSAVQITVVIPALDAAKTIGTQLDALAEQQFDRPWEIVVVDNGSTDSTGEIARGWRHHENCVLRVVFEPRRGLNVARNAGIEAATSDRIAICDADDRVDPQWLTHLDRSLDDADLAAGGMSFSALNDEETMDLLGWQDDREPRSSIGREFGFLDQVICGNVALKREVWSTVGGFDETFSEGGDDVDFSWRAQLAGFTVADCREAVLDYRGRATRRMLFGQYVRDGSGAAHLYSVYRVHGMPRRSTASALKSVVALLVQVPTLPFRNRAEQGHLIRAAGKQWGRIRGSLRHRVVYL